MSGGRDCAAGERRRSIACTRSTTLSGVPSSDRADLGLVSGDSFEEVFRENVECYGDLIATTPAWLPDEVIPGSNGPEEVRGNGTCGELFRWHGGPAEIVFVDGAKSWAGLAHFLRELAPSLTRNSLLVFQDYKFWGSYWVPMMSELLADRLQIAHVLPANTVAFRVSLPLPTARIGAMPDSDTGVALLERAAGRLREHGDQVGASVVQLSSVRFLAHSGDTSAAIHTLRQVARVRPLVVPRGQVLAVHRWLESYAGRELALPRIRSRTVMQAITARARRVTCRARASIGG